jgi:photosystem II stability/assembly factor-like uncharacterized protein
MFKKILYIFALNYLILFGTCFSQVSWYPYQTGVTDNFTSVHFYNSLYGMAVSSNGKIIKTTNGGVNWVQINPVLSMNFAEVRIISLTNACAAGKLTSNSYLSILFTTNAGSSWDSVYTYNQTAYTFNNMRFFGDTGFVSYNSTISGSALRSYNGGANWTFAYGPSMGSYQDFAFVTPMVYFNFCYENLFVPNPYPHYENKQYCLKTTNGGSGWLVTQYDNTSTSYGLKAYFYDINTGYMFKSNGDFRATNNSGLNWYYNPTIPFSSITSVHLNSGTNIFMSGKSTSNIPCIAKSTNGGVNWAITNIPNVSNVNKVFLINQTTGWAACDNGLIYKTTDGGLTNIASENNVSAKYKVYQNYPNPFNPTTYVKFSILNSGDVKIVVYDLMGREVQTLVNERLQPGTYETTFDGSNLTSGVYFYRIFTEGYTETRKMLLLK